MESPRPFPCGFVVKNGSSTRGRSPEGMPVPVSSTEISTTPSTARTVTVIRPPSAWPHVRW